MDTLKKIPYGISSYKTIREKNCYYVDKTRFIPELEAAGEYLFLMRPRRFGKSSWMTLLESYYDMSREDEFDFLFAGTYIEKHPTPGKNSCLILKFNFSQVSPDPEKVEASFEEHAETCFFFFGERYGRYLGKEYFAMMDRKTSAHGKLEFLSRYVGSKGLKLYVLIDECDNFANTILAGAGRSKYHELTHGAGFFRFFFNVLKGATDLVDSGVGRMFITGVSPVAMDDVTSGFNIGRNISLLPEFNRLLGFTAADVAELLGYYGLSPSESRMAMDMMSEWYDNYRFSDRAEQALFNTDMVLYFMIHFLKSRKPPDQMVDSNVRIDYGKLRHFIILDRRRKGNFSYLERIVRERETEVATIPSSFPAEQLANPENFVSLLFYFGLLSYSGRNMLRIPNRSVGKLMYGYLREAYRDADVFGVDLWLWADLIRAMAREGDWAPVFRFLAAEVERQTSIKDFLTGEKVVQTFLLAYFNVVDYFVTKSEEEMGKGFADLFLEPFSVKYPDLDYSYLIELKYVKRSDYSESKLEGLLEAAENQLRKYASDKRVVGRRRSANLKCVALVFAGWEMKASAEYAPEQLSGP